MLAAPAASTPGLPKFGKGIDTQFPAPQPHLVLWVHCCVGDAPAAGAGVRNSRAPETLHLLLQPPLTKPGQLARTNLITPNLVEYNTPKHTEIFYSMYITRWHKHKEFNITLVCVEKGRESEDTCPCSAAGESDTSPMFGYGTGGHTHHYLLSSVNTDTLFFSNIFFN